MAVSIALVARVPLDYYGSSVAAGEVFAAKPLDALRLQHRRLVEFAPPGAKLGKKKPVQRTRPASTYERRDLRAKS